MAYQIDNQLWLGNLKDAETWGKGGNKFISICVMDREPMGSPGNSYWISIMDGPQRASKTRLQAVAQMIDAQLAAERIVLVYSQSGLERAPLALAYYLHWRRGMSLDNAYELVATKYSGIKRCDAWLY
jgi:hypothetical protein